MGLFRTVKENVADGASFVKRTGEKAIDTTIEAGKVVVETADDVTEATYYGVKEVTVWIKDKAVEAGEWTKDKAVATGEWTKNKVQETIEIVQGLAEKGKKELNDIAGKLSEDMAKAAIENKTVEKCIEGTIKAFNVADDLYQRVAHLGKDPHAEAKEKDGQFMGPDCPKSSPNVPTQGRLPDSCKNRVPPPNYPKSFTPMGLIRPLKLPVPP